MEAPAPDTLAGCRAEALARPMDAAAQFALSNALWAAGEREAAVAGYQRTLTLDPTLVDARNNLGNALCSMDRHAEAIAQYRAALLQQPERVELHYNLGNALVGAGDIPQSEQSFQRAIALRPDHAGAQNNLGNALRSMGRHEEAIECYRRALTLRPEYFGTLNNIGSALLALHRPAEAEDWFRRTLAARPDYAEAANNLGGALLALATPEHPTAEEALIWFRRAYTLDPGQVQARFGEAMALLLAGDFRAGWRAYESRWLDPSFREGEPEFTAPLWRGETDIAGRTILLHAEQGLGDSIQFVRYAPLLRARGAQVVLSVQPPLVRLFEGLADAVLPQGAPLPPHDLHCPLLSLPHAFATDLADVPASIPYLHADPARMADWAKRLGPRRCLRVGVAWSGSPDHPDDAIRSIPAARLLPALRATGAELHAVQKTIGAADRDGLDGVHLHEFSDFADTAGLLACLDLVISVDTSVAHLAGAMAVPVWVLLQTANDFRWMRGRTDSPWYPGMRLFRQHDAGDWRPVIDSVRAALEGGPQHEEESSLFFEK